MEQIANLVIYFVPFLFSLSFHEASHAWMANRLGDPTARQMGRMTLYPGAHIDWIGTILFPVIMFLTNAPLFGWAKPVPVNERNLRHRRAGLWVAAAGPGSNLVLALGFTGLLFLLNRTENQMSANQAAMFISQPLKMMAAAGIQINVILGLFNFLPVPPLDGGRVAKDLFPPFSKSFFWLERYGFLLLLFLMWTGILSQILMPIARPLLHFLFGLTH